MRESMSDPAARLKAIRLQSGKTPGEIASSCDMSLPSYYDLEAHSGELTSAISLGQLAKLAKALQIESASLFTDRPVGTPIGALDISALVKEYLGMHSMSLSKLGDEIGYDIDNVLDFPDSISDWNIDCLRALSAKIGFDWLAAIPSR